MKIKTILILSLIVVFPILAQDSNSLSLTDRWAVGLNFSAYTFKSENNLHNFLFSLERKISDHFFISLNTGITSYQPKKSNGLSSFEVLSTGNTVTKMSSTEFEESTRIPLHLSLRYQPFDWSIAPYLSLGYGMEYWFSSNSTYITKTSIRSLNGNLISEDEIKTIRKNNGSFINRAYYKVGTIYEINSNLHFDANVLITGSDPAYLSFGIRYGF